MDAGTKSLDPPVVEGPLSFRHGDIDFNLPLVTESMCCERQLNLKLFIEGFALCNYANIRSLSKNVFVIAADELAVQRFANHEKSYTRLLRLDLQSQFKTPEGISVLNTCDTWATFIHSDTVLVDLLGVFLKATTLGPSETSNGEAVESKFGALQEQAGVKAHGHSSNGPVSISENQPSPQAITSSAPTMGPAVLQRGQLPVLVNENKSLHVLLPWKKKSLSAHVSHVHVVRPSTSGPHQLIELVPAFELSLVVRFESQALRNKALRMLRTEIFILDGYKKGPMDVVPLTDDARIRNTSMVLTAGAPSALREELENFFTYNSYVRNTELTPGPRRNGIAGYYITALGSIHEFKRPWLLKIMTANEDHQTLRVEAQPKENCQLCRPDPPKVQNTGPSKDPRITAREFARLNRPKLSTTAPPTPFRQPSGSADSEDAKCNVSERSSDPLASHGQSTEPSARPEAAGTSGQTNEPSTSPEAAADSKAAHPACTKSQTQPDFEAVQNSMEPRRGTKSNNDYVPEEEKSRRRNAGLCIACEGQRHTEKNERCLIGWTYKGPLKTSTQKLGSPTGPSKRSGSVNGYSGSNDKRGRRL